LYFVKYVDTVVSELKGDLMFKFKDAKEKLIAARVKMLFAQPFFGNIACRLQLVKVEEDWLPTAATDGRHFYYNPEFINKLDLDETVFLVGHEIGHCIYEHFIRRGPRDPKIWNMAGDYKINGMLIQNKIGNTIRAVKPLYDAKYATDDWTTESIYEDLLKNNAPIEQTLDVHLDMEGEEDDDSGKGNGKGKGKKPTISAEDARALSDELKNAIIQAAQSVGAGKVPADIRRMIGELTEPKMDWRQMLRVSLESTLVSDFTFMRPNRKSQFANVVLPGMKRDQQIDICVAIDVSGSISDVDVRDFLSEVQGIMDQFEVYRIRIWCFDTRVSGKDEFTGDDGRFITDFVMTGGGGTDFMCNWHFMEENEIVPDQFIMFTDGEPCDKWGIEEYCDTLFVIKNPYRKPVAPFGQSAYYE
jgi:predicted metal-dependent peptidase